MSDTWEDWRTPGRTREYTDKRRPTERELQGRSWESLSVEKIMQIRQFVQEEHGEGWIVDIVENARIPFLHLPCWVVTSTHMESRRVVRDLVVEKDWQLHLFDITDVLNLNDRLRVNEEVREL